MITDTQVILFLLVLARVSGFVGFFPLFSKKQLPHLVKVGLAVGLSVFWYGGVAESSGVAVTEELNLTLIESLLLMLKEVSIGVVLATALGLFFLPAKIAGSYVGQELGLSLASISDPGSQDSSTLVSRIFDLFCILLFFAIDLHHFLIMVIDGSFKHLAGKIDLMRLPTEHLVAMFTDVIDYGFLIVAPVAILFGLITIGLAFSNKAAPTLNLFSVGMSIRSGFGIFCLILFSPVIFSAMQCYLYRVQEDVEQLLVAMRYY